MPILLSFFVSSFYTEYQQKLNCLNNLLIIFMFIVFISFEFCLCIRIIKSKLININQLMNVKCFLKMVHVNLSIVIMYYFLFQ